MNNMEQELINTETVHFGPYLVIKDNASKILVTIHSEFAMLSWEKKLEVIGVLQEVINKIKENGNK
jgi:hypothetical protein